MGDKTGIEWTDATWNPIAGCTIVSPGCTNCYAMQMAARIERMQAALGKPTHYAGLTQHSKAGPVWNGKVVEAPTDILTIPFRWKRPRRVFTNSMSDLFHRGVGRGTIARIFTVMALTPRHTYQVLTKRAERMAEEIDWLGSEDGQHAMRRVALDLEVHETAVPRCWPLPNVWLGVSTENQAQADERIPWLIGTPAARRFVSAEPLLGPIDLLPYLFIYTHEDTARLADESDDVEKNPLPWRDPATTPPEDICSPRLDWVIVGGESGKDARPMHPDWVRQVRTHCEQAEVPLFFKQWGEWAPRTVEPGGRLGDDMRRGEAQFVKARGEPDGHFRKGDAIMGRIGKKAAGALLDGKLHREFPS